MAEAPSPWEAEATKMELRPPPAQTQLHPEPDQTSPPPAAAAAPQDVSAVDYAKPWLLQTVVVRAHELKQSVAQTTDVALQSARSHLGDLQSVSSHHVQSAQDLVHRAQIQYKLYEDIFFGKLKEGLYLAGDHPVVTYSTVAGLGILLMRRPRQVLFRYTIGQFQNEESLLVSSEKRVKEMRQSVDLLKNESKKLEERARLAEEELQRGQTKLKYAGSQLQNLVSSFYKTESQARGLRDGLRELPGRDALRLRAEVASMVAEANKERLSLTKKVTKIANYGIPV
eukprot:c3318_g1_i1 orf=528-1379(-)